MWALAMRAAPCTMPAHEFRLWLPETGDSMASAAGRAHGEGWWSCIGVAHTPRLLPYQSFGLQVKTAREFGGLQHTQASAGWLQGS